MRRIFLLGMCLGTLMVFGQDEKTDSVKYWKAGGTSSLAFSQVTLTNWSGGGKNSMAGTFLLKTFLNYNKKRVSWDNNFDFGYGLTKQGSENLVKTDDKIQLVSKFGYEAKKNWYYTVMGDFKTQVTVGYQDPPKNTTKISDWMAPGYLTFSLGMDYKPNDNFSLFISPLTEKMTFVIDDSLSNAGAFGVDPGDNFRGEAGALAKMIYKKDNLVKNIDFFTKVDFFSSLEENPENIDVNWEITFNMKVNSFLSAVLTGNMIYDDDIKYVDSDGVEHGPRVQFKQLFGLGLNYKF